MGFPGEETGRAGQLVARSSGLAGKASLVSWDASSEGSGAALKEDLGVILGTHERRVFHGCGTQPGGGVWCLCYLNDPK